MNKYKRIDTRTLKGLKQAEKLKKSGWKIANIGFWNIQFYKKQKRKGDKNEQKR